MAKATQKLKINKSAWIRQQPASLTAREVVEKAAKENIQLSATQVYMARSTLKKAAGEGTTEAAAQVAAAPVAKGKPGRKPGAAKPGPKPKSGATSAATPDAASIRQTFIRLATRLGTDEMRRMIDGLDQVQA